MQPETVPARNTGTSRSRETARRVLETEAEAVAALIPRLDHRFDQAIELLIFCTGRVVLSERKGLRPRDFARLHPGGGLGAELILVSDLMHRGDEIPKAAWSASMQDVIDEISRKGLGIAGIVAEDDRLVGVISDGDLRRMLQSRGASILGSTAAECMTPNPVTIGDDQLATKALHLMERKKITSLLVPDTEGRLVGIIHIHDLWRTEMF